MCTWNVDANVMVHLPHEAVDQTVIIVGDEVVDNYTITNCR